MNDEWGIQYAEPDPNLDRILTPSNGQFIIHHSSFIISLASLAHRHRDPH